MTETNFYFAELTSELPLATPAIDCI